jgi:hypothetical protein
MSLRRPGRDLADECGEVEIAPRGSQHLKLGALFWQQLQ